MAAARRKLRAENKELKRADETLRSVGCRTRSPVTIPPTSRTGRTAPWRCAGAPPQKFNEKRITGSSHRGCGCGLKPPVSSRLPAVWVGEVAEAEGGAARCSRRPLIASVGLQPAADCAASEQMHTARLAHGHHACWRRRTAMLWGDWEGHELIVDKGLRRSNPLREAPRGPRPSRGFPIRSSLPRLRQRRRTRGQRLHRAMGAQDLSRVSGSDADLQQRPLVHGY